MKIFLRKEEHQPQRGVEPIIVVDVILDETVLPFSQHDHIVSNVADIEGRKCYVCVWRAAEIISSFLYKNYESPEVNLFLSYGSPYFVAKNMNLTQIINEISNIRFNEKGYHICISNETGLIPAVLLNRGISIYAGKHEIVFSHHDEADAMELRLSL